MVSGQWSVVSGQWLLVIDSQQRTTDKEQLTIPDHQVPGQRILFDLVDQYLLNRH